MRGRYERRVMNPDDLFDDPIEMTNKPDPEDLRWGLAVPEGWRHRDRKPVYEYKQGETK